MTASETHTQLTAQITALVGLDGVKQGRATPWKRTESDTDSRAPEAW